MANDSLAPLRLLGERLRTLRARRGASLSEIAAATGISASTLSRLESGQRKPSLELVLPLASEYGVSLDELMALPTARDPRITPVVSELNGQLVQALSRRSSPTQVRRTRIPGSATPPPRTPVSHPGFDWVYVLSGTLVLLLGETEWRLGPGQAAEFDTSTPHWFGPADHRAVDYLSLFTHAGERAHDHRGE
ncbi:XRE family transcriptional regulator [Galactobacter valiniphilus]|uniref:XRE family transcriptional regulator n=1 Tax=Galactobacter valiniphilus TaxID=2676122 RepID=A0A399JEI4_9MICC|nr:XRE family transcriptional regulator [Galactobacter valiniphilus]RII42512.1 XRE family transcriptional regulator [Galactobacter valiniphilus]